MKQQGNTIAAMVLAAGYGERMMPLTAVYPKPLVPILGIPLFEILVQKLLREGAQEIHCNLFHLPENIETFAAGRGWPITFHRERELLGTGGGIGNMADGVSHADAILLHNGDILSDIRYEPALALHQQSGALVTLVLVPSGPAANVAVTGAGAVATIGPGAEALAGGAQLLGYTGMAVLSPESLAFFPRGKKKGFIDILLELVRKKPGSVIGWNAASHGARYAWGEAGSPSGYLEIHRCILIEKLRFDTALEPPPFPFHVGEGASVEPGARWKGFCEIGRRAVVERDASLENCVVFDETVVPRDSVHENEILFPGGIIKAAGDL
jgi:NDP-sugar pyrophosphorylase family protein